MINQEPASQPTDLTVPLAPIKNPYVGPLTFQIYQSHLYFGREREARDLHALILSNRVVVLHSQSGAGKSSLINTKLTHSLLNEGYEVLPVGRVGGDLPGKMTVPNLYTYNLMQILDQKDMDDERFAQARLSEFLLNLSLIDGKWIYTPPIPRVDDSSDQESEADDIEIDEETDNGDVSSSAYVIAPRVLIIDQFEEILTTSPNAREQRIEFFTQIRQALEDDPYLSIVFAMRADYFADLSPYVHLVPGSFRIRYHMEQMTPEAALRAIREPAELGGRPFAEGVAEQLVKNLRQVRRGGHLIGEVSDYVEPVQLQVVCLQLWERLQDRPLSSIEMNDLESSGDVDQALRAYYEDTIKKVVDEEAKKKEAKKPGSDPQALERLLRNWFSNELITETGIRGFVLQGTEKTGRLPNTIVAQLQNRFLVRSADRAGGKWIELVHDRFIEPIRRANDQWRDEQLAQNPVALAAKLWREAGEPEGLLLNESQLRQALASTSRTDADPLVADFLHKSEEVQKHREMAETQKSAAEAKQRADEANRRAEEARIRAEKEERDAKELRQLNNRLKTAEEEANRRAAEARDLAEKEKRNAQRLRQRGLWLTAAAAMALIALGIAVVGWWYAGQQTQIAVAESNRAAAEKYAADQARADLEKETRRGNALSLASSAKKNLVENPVLSLLLAHTAVSNTLNYDFGEDTKVQTETVDALYQAIQSFAGIQRYVLAGHTDRIAGVAYSMDGKYIATGSSDYTAKLWDAATGNELFTFQGHQGSVLGVAFSPDSKLLATAGGDNSVRIWDVSTGQETLVLRGHHAEVISVDFSPDGAALASASSDRTAIIWDVVSGAQVFTLTGHSDRLQAVAFRSDGKQIATASVDNSIKIFDAATGKEVRALCCHDSVVDDVESSPDGLYWATSSDDGKVKLWDTATGENVATFCCHNGWIDGIAFSPDGKRLASGSQDQTIKLWDVESGRELGVLAGHTDHIWEVAFSPDGNALVSGSSDSTARIWYLPSDSMRFTTEFRAHEAALKGLAFSDDDARLSSVDTRGEVKFWSSRDSTPTSVLTDAMQMEPTHFALDASGVHLMKFQTEEDLLLWDSNDQTIVTVTLPVTVSSTNLSYTLALADDDKSLFLLDPLAGEIFWWPDTNNPEGFRLFPPSEEITITHFTLSPDQRFRLSVDDQARAWLDEFSSQEIMFTNRTILPGTIMHPSKATFNDDGTLLALIDQRGAISVWQLEDRLPFMSLSQEGDVTALAFDHQHHWLAVASTEGAAGSRVRLYDLVSKGQASLTFPQPTSVAQIAFSHDGMRLAVGGEDGKIRLYPLDPRFAFDIACQFTSRNLTFEEWQNYQREIPDPYVCPNRPVDASVIRNDIRTSSTVTVTDGIKNALARLRRMDFTALPAALVPEAMVADALIDLAQSEVGNGNWEKSLEYLEAIASLLSQPSTQRLVRSATQYQSICQQASSSSATQHRACTHATEIALATSDLRLNRGICELAGTDTTDEFVALVQPACEHAVTLVEAQQDALASMALCALQSDLHKLLKAVFEPACQQAVTLTQASEDAELNVTVCQEGLQASLSDLVLPICQRSISLAAETQDFSLNLRLCQTTPPSGDDTLFAPACQQAILAASPITGNTIAAGEAITASLQTGDRDLWSFYGQEGQWVSITMRRPSDSTDTLDPYLKLLDDQFNIVAENDDSGDRNSLINLRLSQTMTYLVEAKDLSGAAGDYELVISAQTPQRLAYGDVVRGNTISQTIWLFRGSKGKVVDLALDSTDEGFDPRLELLDETGGVALGSDDDSGGDLNALISGFVLPADGEYLVKVGRPGNADYQLALTPIEPTPLTFDQAVTVTSSLSPVWSFAGKTGQIIEIEWGAAHGSSPPLLALVNEAGQDLSLAEDGDGDGVSTIKSLILPQDSLYYIKLGREDNPYRLSLRTGASTTIHSGELITATGQFTTLWRFDGTAGQIVDIAVDAISADFDPSVSLLRFDGVALLSDDNSGDGLNARIQQFLLPDSALYFIKISGGGVQRAYTLTLNTGIASLLAFNQPVTSTTQITSLWRFTGAAGQVVDIQLAGASESFDPSLALLAPDGRELAYNDDGGKGNSSYDAYLQNVVLPQSGEYFIRAGRAGSQSVYTLTLTAITPLTTAIGSPIALGDGPLWQFPGATGQIVHIAHIGSGESAPRFTLVSPMGESLVADAKETVVKLVSDGNYLLAVRGASEAMGDATIHLEEIGNDQVQPLTVSQTITGELAGLSSSYRRFTGVLSHTIVITLSGETEQLHLALYDPKGNPIAAFDGSINTGEPRLRAALAFTGTYLLTAQGVDAQSQGDYSLTLGLVETNALPIPQACGMTDATADYGPFVIGSQVVLGRHRAVNGDMDWTDEMNQYVDQMAIVEEFDGVDGPGCPGVHVDIDNGRWFWRIRDMVLVDP